MNRLVNIPSVFWNKSKGFLKKAGINGLIALIIWLSPSWLSFFIPSLKDFALIWIGLVISPIVPSWLAVPLLAVIVGLVRKGAVLLYRWIKDQLVKLGLGAELMTLADREEAELILARLRIMKEKKDKAVTDFKQKLKQDRIELITENWETELENEQE